MPVKSSNAGGWSGRILGVVTTLAVAISLSLALGVSTSAADVQCAGATPTQSGSPSGTQCASSQYGYPYANAPDCDEFSGPPCASIDAWGFIQGQCVSWVAYRFNQLNPEFGFLNSYGGQGLWGWADHWGSQADVLHIPRDNNPAPGAIALYAKDHVAFVETVNSPTSVVVSEMNYEFHNGFWVHTVTKGTSGWPTSFIHLKDLPTSRPAQPTSPRVTSTTGSTAVLAWTDASNNETAFDSHYRIGNGDWVAGPSVGPNVTSMTAGGLTPGKTYTFQVGARNSVGTKWSIYFPGVTASLPAEPTNPRATSMTGSSAVLTWTDASNNETRFVSQYRIGNGTWAAGPSVGPNATSMTVGGLSFNTPYTFQVGAQNAAGTHWSIYFTGITPQVLPAEPTNLSRTSASASSVTLAWTDASNNELTFVSQYRSGSGSWVAGPSVNANVTSMTFGGLASNTSFTFQIGAQNSAGTHWSAYLVTATAAVPVLPAEPTNLGMTSASASSVTLAWTDASNNEAAFVSQYRIGSGAWVGGPSVGANVTSMTFGGLSSSTPYTFQIGAQNSAGTHWSAYFSMTTPAVPPPPPPPPPSTYHAGRQVAIDTHATGGVSGHLGPDNSYATGPTYPANSPIWIVCYVNGQSITGPYNTTTIWDLGNDGYYYTDAWLYTGTNSAAVPACAPRTVTIDSHATGGVSGHRGPDNSYATGPTHATNSAITIFCYVDGQAITGPYNTTTIWDLSNDGYYYTDAWLYTGTNNAAVPHC
jgi:surface antigen